MYFVSSVTIFSLNVPVVYLDNIGMFLSDFMGIIAMGNDLKIFPEPVSCHKQ